MIVLVACGAAKRAEASKAGELYRGAMATCALRWARTVTDVGHIYVVSAKWGLLPHEQVVEPYQLRLGQPGAISAGTLRHQAMTAGILHEPVVVAGGKEYVKLVRDAWVGPVRVPFGAEAGHTKQGYMMAAMNAAHGRVP